MREALSLIIALRRTGRKDHHTREGESCNAYEHETLFALIMNGTGWRLTFKEEYEPGPI